MNLRALIDGEQRRARHQIELLRSQLFTLELAVADDAGPPSPDAAQGLANNVVVLVTTMARLFAYRMLAES